MIGVSTILSIKQRCAAGDSVAQVAREEGVSEPTVRKYRDMDDMSPQLPVKKERGSKLDPYKPIIDAWLIEDRKRRRKQRHTAKRVHERLKAEHGYEGGYSLVQAYVKQRKAEVRAAADMFLELEWAPGEAQVDFGECEFRVLGVVRTVHYLVATFPFSNVSLAQVFWGENSECVCEGLKAIFEFAGGVPARLVFDNATGVGRRIGEEIRTAATFRAFAAHYGFEFTFCNPYSGHEKGAVENAVGAIRRNLFVPMPSIDNVRAYNKRLLGKCMDRASKDHYEKAEPERQLFVEDRAALLDLPAKPFRVFKPDTCKTDKYGRACLEGRHRYPLGPEHACERALVELGAFDVAFFDERGGKIASFERAYGDAPTEATDPLSQLALLCRKPGAWRNSQVRAAIPDDLRRHMDALSKAGRKDALRAMRDASAQAGWAATVEAMTALAASGGALAPADVMLGAMFVANGQHAVDYESAADLSGYDAAFARSERS